MSTAEAAASRRLLPFLLLLLLPPVDACGRRPARIQLPPAQYLRPFVFRKVPCEQHEQLFCANGGRCMIPVKWSVVHGRIEERLDRPSCECPTGYAGYNCDIPVLPSTLDLSTAAFVSVFLFVALLALLLLVLAYLCWARMRRRRTGWRAPLTAPDGVAAPLATVAMLADRPLLAAGGRPFDRASVRDFIDDCEDDDYDE